MLVEFATKYYVDEEDRPNIDDVCMYWIGGDIGGVVDVEGDFWNVNDMVEALKLDVDRDILFNWYYYITDATEEDVKYNLKTYVQMGMGIEK